MFKVLPSAKQRDILVLVGDMNVLTGRIASSEKHFDKPIGMQMNRPHKVDGLLRIGGVYKLYLIATDFNHRQRQTHIWRSNNPANP